MAPEDCRKALMLMAGTKGVSPGQRQILTESAALIAFQQKRLAEMQAFCDNAKLNAVDIIHESNSLRGQMENMRMLQEQFRAQLRVMADMPL